MTDNEIEAATVAKGTWQYGGSCLMPVRIIGLTFDYGYAIAEADQQLIEGEQLGIVKNFEQLLKLTKNSYAFLSDQDDVWMKDKIASSLHLMQAMEKKYGR